MGHRGLSGRRAQSAQCQLEVRAPGAPRLLVHNYKDVEANWGLAILLSSEPALFKLVVVEGRVELGRSHSLIVYLTFRGDISLDQMAGQKVGMQAARGVPRVEKCSGTTQAVQHRQCKRATQLGQ